MARPHEYIGVSGVVNQEQQKQLEEMFAEFELRKRRQLQLGVKATHKPQWLEIENKYGREWYPIGWDILHSIQAKDTEAVGAAQIFMDTEHVTDEDYRAAFLNRVVGITALYWLRRVQFDLLPDWCENPDLTSHLLDTCDKLYAGRLPFRKNGPNLTKVLQCQASIMDMHSPQEVAGALAGLGDKLDYVLFDASGGRGVRMNPEALLPYIEAVRNRPELDELGVAVGGGLNTDVVRSELPKILRHFPDVSWDAEGQLHPVNSDGKRPLDMRACREYFEASAEVLR